VLVVLEVYFEVLYKGRLNPITMYNMSIDDKLFTFVQKIKH